MCFGMLGVFYIIDRYFEYRIRIYVYFLYMGTSFKDIVRHILPPKIEQSAQSVNNFRIDRHDLEIRAPKFLICVFLVHVFGCMPGNLGAPGWLVRLTVNEGTKPDTSTWHVKSWAVNLARMPPGDTCQVDGSTFDIGRKCQTLSRQPDMSATWGHKERLGSLAP